MKPINDRVVVQPAPAEEKTKGGIIIPFITFLINSQKNNYSNV